MKYLILFVFVGSMWSCTVYQRYPLATERLHIINTAPLSFYLLDAGKPQQNAWYLTNYRFGVDSMKVDFIKMPPVEAADLATITGKRDARMSKNDVLFYLKGESAAALSDTGHVTIPYSLLQKIEAHEINHEKTLASNLAWAGVIIMGIGLIGGGEN